MSSLLHRVELVDLVRKSLTAILLAGDLVALLLFILLGQADHGTLNPSNPLSGAFSNVIAFVVPWLIAALVLGAYRGSSPSPELGKFLGTALLAWLVAAPWGMELRAILLDRGSIPVPFFLVTIGVGGAFLLLWRLIFWLVFLRRRRAPPPR